MRSLSEIERLMRSDPQALSDDEHDAYLDAALLLGYAPLGIAPLREPPPTVPAWLDRRHGVSPPAKALWAVCAEKLGQTRAELYGRAGAVDLDVAEMLWGRYVAELFRVGLVREDIMGRMVAVGGRAAA